ncbi:MAG: family 10 glycosylhydrolase [Kiritimatiellaeota bacterium]|nr:family 10 glycosylhydrolase [Kiritimatiellota bacterium]
MNWVFIVTWTAAGALVAAACTAGEARPAKLPPAVRGDRTGPPRRSRRVIFDNDGMDAQFLPTPTPEALLDVRTRPLLDTKVTTVFYCSRSSGLGVFTHNTRVGEVFTSREGRYKDNATAAFIRQGTDPLRIVTEFCRKHGLEVFWTLRMNDCHDVIHRPDRPYPAFSHFKKEHPEWLMGRWDKRPPHGAWSAFDFAVPEVRKLVADCVEEVCRKYDVDGIHLDFFRHLMYFREVAQGGRATPEHIELMTDLIRRIRRITERAGAERGRPILLAVRVPDSVGYCRGMGLDVERWLSEHLVDMLIVSGYFRLNPWRVSVELGHRYGVPVIAGLSESRGRGEPGPWRRNTDASYRARAAAAWAAQCDGVYLFNLYDARRKFLSQIHDPDLLARLEQDAFLTVRDPAGAARPLAGGLSFLKRPVLTPEHVWALKPGLAREAPFELGDPAGRPARLMVLASMPGADLRLSLRGRRLRFKNVENGWLCYDIPAGLLAPGINTVRIVAPLATKAQTAFSARDIAKYWLLRGSNIPGKAFEKLTSKGLLIADRSTRTGHYHYRAFPWAVGPGDPAVVTVRMRHITGWSSVAFADGRNEDRLMFYPDHIELQHCGLRHAMDTTDGFHDYRVEIGNHDVRVFVDGKLRIDGRGRYNGRASGNRTMVLLGAATSNARGEAIFQRVTLETQGAALRDLVIVLPEVKD